ncbi:MAG: inositol phosphorylceramide synthase [Muribaculaceae bacterium]|nr:inositol phosphorylceramide synthase [Muribaculaceae bacterium]
MNKIVKLPSLRESIAMVVCLAVWLVVTGLCIGMRPEHGLLAFLIAGLFFFNGATRSFVVALIPFALFGISYDWMNLLPNYEVNPIDVKDLYDAEKAMFGIATSQGVLTPNEFFAIHNCKLMDFFAGVFYLCWVPVPIAFGIGLYFAKQRRIYLHFAIVFLLVNLIGFACYYIHPAAPPWYVMKYGFEPILGTPGDVAGLGRFDEMTGWAVFDGLYSRNANVFAAIPSLHSAYMVIAFYYSLKARCPWWLRVVFAIIMIGIWFTAVYSCHHYIIDAILGTLCAIVGIVLFEAVFMRISSWKNFMGKYTAYIS